MAGVTLILQLHQPYVLSKHDVLSPGPMIDIPATRLACQRFAGRSINPVNQVLSEVAAALGERFRVTCLVSGVALEIFARFQPRVIASLKRLADAGVMDFAVTPYYHGLACLVDADEFGGQIDDARGAAREHLDHDPITLANTAMLYNDWIGEQVSRRGMTTVIRNPVSIAGAGSVANIGAGIARGANGVDLVACDGWMSQRVAQRFGAADDSDGLLTAPIFAEMLADRSVIGGHRTLLWDYHMFGELFKDDTGVFAFLRHLPGQLLCHGFDRFQYCCDAAAESGNEIVEVAEGGGSRSDYRSSQYEGVSVDGFSAIELLGDPLISHAHNRLYSLKDKVLRSGSDEAIRDWRRMQSWDYVRNMGKAESVSNSGCWINGANSGYEGYVMFMGHCDALASRIDRLG